MELLILLEQELVTLLHTPVIMDLNYLVVILKLVNQMENGQDHHLHVSVQVYTFNCVIY